ncbi:glycosyltransferase family 2 protein [Phaeovulum sp.]|uniref:glycosyltransferase family 2 protein n=1 Tax=Phaeovulum sp. TaxID=2934796 RepID=UPI0039E24351
MSISPELSIIVVSYNTADVTLECLRSVYRETCQTSFELIVVDNNSPDGSAKAIAAEFPDLTLIARPDNLGFGGANNLAAGQASGEYLLLLNPDTVVLRGAIDTLMRFARETPKAGIWGGRTLFADGSLNATSCWRDMSLWGTFCWAVGLTRLWPRSPIFNYDAYGGWRRDTVREVDTVTGCFFLIRRSAWQALGGFDPAFFMYGEEADLCVRARRRGARPMVTPEAEIIHYGGLSDTVRAAKMQRLIRAKITLASRHWGPIRLWSLKVLFRGLVALRMLGFGLQARLLGGQGPKDRAATWRQIWSHRRDWLNGYDEAQ